MFAETVCPSRHNWSAFTGSDGLGCVYLFKFVFVNTITDNGCQSYWLSRPRPTGVLSVSVHYFMMPAVIMAILCLPDKWLYGNTMTPQGGVSSQ